MMRSNFFSSPRAVRAGARSNRVAAWRGYRIIYFIASYLLLGLSAVAQVLAPEKGPVFLLTVGIAASRCMTFDSWLTRRPASHLQEWLAVIAWPIVTPVHLWRTRGAQGVGFAVLLLALTFAVWLTASFAGLLIGA